MGHIVPLARHGRGPVGDDSFPVQPDAVHNIIRHGLFAELPLIHTVAALDVAVPVGVAGGAMAAPQLREHPHAPEPEDVFLTEPMHVQVDGVEVRAGHVELQDLAGPPQRQRVRLQAQPAAGLVHDPGAVAVSQRGQVGGFVVAAVRRRWHRAVVFNHVAPVLGFGETGAAMAEPEHIPVVAIG